MNCWKEQRRLLRVSRTWIKGFYGLERMVIGFRLRHNNRRSGCGDTAAGGLRYKSYNPQILRILVQTIALAIVADTGL